VSARNKRNNVDRLNAFDDKTDLEQVADEIFGASAPPELNTGRIVARPCPIDEIWADVRQPRRAIPASIRLVWNGSPADVPDLLNTWAAVAANAAGRTIDVGAIILGEGDGLDTDGTPPVYESFISLLRLAGSILREGLINPITIIDQRDRHLIESGERRWLAYWLLRLHTQAGDEYARIPAAVASGADYVWRQAAENTARRSLNAVGMARQLALLIMAARGQDQYADYDQIVAPGGSDRRFYAQVADGNTHRIPKGAGERIEAAMGLAKEQLSRYRDILHITTDEEINDLIWLRGDVEDWPESAFRDVNRLPIGNLRTIFSRDAWSLADIRAEVATLTTVKVQPPVQAPPTQGYNAAEAVEARRVLNDIRNGFARVYALETSPDGGEKLAATRATRLLHQAQNYYEHNRLVSANDSLVEAFRILDEAATGADKPPTPPAPGDFVQARSGQTGTLVSVVGRIGTVETPNGRREYDIQHLQKVNPPAADESGRVSEYEISKFLKWAWRWAMGHLEGGGWFTRQDCQTEPGHLGVLMLKNYLQQSTTHKGEREIVRYRITPLACKYLGAGFDVIDWEYRERSAAPDDDDQDDQPDEPVQPPPGGTFMIGDRIDTRLGRTGGVIVAFEDGGVRVDFPGSPPFLTNVKNLVFVERPAPQPASDKSPSTVSKTGYVVDREERIYAILMTIRHLATITGYPETVTIINELLGLNWETARQLNETNQLASGLASYADNIHTTLNAWSSGVSAYLSDIFENLGE